MKNRYIQQFEDAQLKDKTMPAFKAGDTLRLGITIKEGEKTRTQYFEGVCIAIRGNGVDKTFCVRKIGANNIGVEKIFPFIAKVWRALRCCVWVGCAVRSSTTCAIGEVRQQGLKKSAINLC